jgi:hypothetical protein
VLQDQDYCPQFQARVEPRLSANGTATIANSANAFIAGLKNERGAAPADDEMGYA